MQLVPGAFPGPGLGVGSLPGRGLCRGSGGATRVLRASLCLLYPQHTSLQCVPTPRPGYASTGDTGFVCHSLNQSRLWIFVPEKGNSVLERTAFRSKGRRVGKEGREASRPGAGPRCAVSPHGSAAGTHPRNHGASVLLVFACRSLQAGHSLG